eukprot:13138533-Alexandrium_andersonii.AAC.1
MCIRDSATHGPRWHNPNPCRWGSPSWNSARPELAIRPRACPQLVDHSRSLQSTVIRGVNDALVLVRAAL